MGWRFAQRVPVGPGLEISPAGRGWKEGEGEVEDGVGVEVGADDVVDGAHNVGFVLRQFEEESLVLRGVKSGHGRKARISM